MSRKTNKKLNLGKPVFIAVILTMLIGSIFMAVDSATSGAEISKLEQEISQLEKRNRELTQEIVGASSVSAIDTTAESLGFAKAEKTVYLTIEDVSAAYVR